MSYRLARPGERYTLEYVHGQLRRVALPGSVHDARGVFRAASRRLRRHMRREAPEKWWSSQYYHLLNAQNLAEVALRTILAAPRQPARSRS